MEDLCATCLPPACWYNWYRYVNVDGYPAILVFEEAGARQLLSPLSTSEAGLGVIKQSWGTATGSSSTLRAKVAGWSSLS